MLRTTRWFLLFILALSAVSVLAQRVLTLPVLSTLTGPDGIGELSVDPKSGMVYASGFSSRLSGVKANGLARLQGGVPDLSWRPTTAPSVSSRPVFATSGELYFIGNSVVDAPYPFLLSIAPSAGSEPVVRFIPALPAAVSGTVRLQAIAGGYDHWLYFTLLELTGENGQTATSRIGRLDTRSNTVDSWGYALPARTVMPTVGADGSLYTVSSGYAAPGNSSTVPTRLRNTVVRWAV